LQAGILVFAGDKLDPLPSSPTDAISEATLQRANPIVVRVDEEVFESRAVSASVGQALSKVGIALQGLDYSIPAMNEPVPESGEITVIRVREEIIIEQSPLPFTTEYQPNPDQEIDQQSFEDPGTYGVVATRVRIRYEDGDEISRSIEDEWVAQEADPRTIGYGTNIVIRTLNTPNGTIEYWRAIQMYATSYSPSRAGVPDDYPYFGITACGKKLVKGLVAIDRNYIPFYTQMYVPGYGFAEACDTGSGVKGRWIDLGYEDDNYEAWHQYVTVYFLTPVPPASSIAWVFP
jgi:3D (Asp-Asp-Asp) domain-containing protein